MFPVKAKGLCNAHYARALKNGGDPGSSPIKPQNKEWGCSFGGCDKQRSSLGLCVGHYSQKRLGRELEPLRPHRNLSFRNEDGQRQCARCAQWVDPSNFHKSGNTSDRLGSHCRHCRQESKLLQNFKITEDEYQAMKSSQGGGCAICGCASSGIERLSVDHDHSCCPGKGLSCGKCVRGLLCADCNRAIGMMADDPLRLRAAASYLEKWGK